MQLTFCPLYSGSSGNALFVGAGNTRILIDAGLSGRTISDALTQIGVLPETLSAILVTHEHSDHVRGAGILARKYRVPLYANERTWQAMARTVGEIAPPQRRIFDGSDFYVGDLAVHPFSIPHDAADPVGYRVYYGGRSVSVATDMGHMQKRVLRELAGSDLLLLESNHDPDMLMQNPHYSYALKQRILGNHGHLSNASCAETLPLLGESGVRNIILGHLSGENNTPELALNTALSTLTHHGITPDVDMCVDMAWRERIGNFYFIE